MQWINQFNQLNSIQSNQIKSSQLCEVLLLMTLINVASHLAYEAF